MASKPQDGDLTAAVLGLHARAALTDRRRVVALIEEHQRAGVEAKTLEILAELLETGIERAAVGYFGPPGTPTRCASLVS